MKLSLTLIFILLAGRISAQYLRPEYKEIYAGPGAITAFSDIGDFNTGYAVNVGFRYRLDNHFSLRANIISGLIYGSDEGSKNNGRGITYSTFIIDPTGQLEFFIFREKKGFSRTGHLIFKPVVNPYLLAGAGGIYFNPDVRYRSNTEEPHYTKFTTAITGGGGLNFAVNKKWSVNAELSGRYITTDYLDGYSSYASKSNDIYYVTTVDIIYRIIPNPRRKR
jgi:opacity protein-like surface antigen